MPRKAREKSKSGIYHIVIRGNNGRNIFQEEEDKQEFLNILKYCRESDHFLFFAYAFFADHVHLIIREEDINTANILKHITTKYVRWYNKKYGETGRLLHDRYLSEPVDSEEDLMRTIRYCLIHGEKHHGGQACQKEMYNAYQEYKKEQSEWIESDIIFGLLDDDAREAMKLFDAFLGLKNEDAFVDIGTERIIFSDQKIKEMISETYGVENGDLSVIDKERQTQILNEMKGLNGISIRRLARASGVTKFIVEKA